MLLLPLLLLLLAAAAVWMGLMGIEKEATSGRQEEEASSPSKD